MNCCPPAPREKYARASRPSPVPARPSRSVSQLDQLCGNGHCRGRRAGLRRIDGLSHHWRRRAELSLRRPGHLFSAADVCHRWRCRCTDRHVRQWIRWRMHKPLSFGRFPKWDLNLASERKALLSVAIGAAIISVPAIFGASQAYLYTDDVSFCGAVCHSMTPEYVTYRLSPHAHVTCAQCHVGPGATGYVESKIRGMVELLETIQNDYPRPIPAPVTALHTIQTNCEQCHWPSNFFGTREVRRVHFMSDEQNTRWETDLLVSGRRRRVRGGRADGDSLARREQGRIHRERRRTAEYSMGARRWTRRPAWRRSTPPRGKRPAPHRPGEIRTMDCVDCHNRPSHILQSPEQSVDAALAGGRSMPRSPLSSSRAWRRSRRPIRAGSRPCRESRAPCAATIRRLTRKFTRTSSQASTPASPICRTLTISIIFPSMKVRWDTYSTNDDHYLFHGMFPLPRRPAQERGRKCDSLRLRRMPHDFAAGQDRRHAICQRAGGADVRASVDIGDLWAAAGMQFLPHGRIAVNRCSINEPGVPRNGAGGGRLSRSVPALGGSSRGGVHGRKGNRRFRNSAT